MLRLEYSNCKGISVFPYFMLKNTETDTLIINNIAAIIMIGFLGD